ncbi:hypothetical protein ACLOJK_016590 [Asimina triloba]
MSIFQYAVQSAIRKIGDIIIQTLLDEAIFLWGVGDQVRLMETEFRRMQSFLKDADDRQLHEERVRNWVRDVLHVAYNAEDAIDTFVFEIAPLRQSEGRLNTIKRYVFIFSELKALHKLGSAIGRIQIEIRAISESRSTYGIESISQGEATSSAVESLRAHRLSSPHVQERDFIGFENELDMLIGDLIKEEKRLCVVSLVGMGGLGKTTLAKKAYNHVSVQGHFCILAWVSVSQQYSVKELLKAIGRQCSVGPVEQIDRMTAEDLMGVISSFLRERRYLIVLDDTWQNEAWDCLQNTFPDEGSGSRILFTTRNKDVAVYADAQSEPHELRFFEEHESWQLFCKKAFPGQEEIGCPPDLEPTAREIVKNCGGLPLAIVVMGGLLSSRKALAEWHKVLKSIRWQLAEGQARISRILSLSYEDLPYSLKPCFLYLGMFPEDYEIPANTLIRMWVAEGLFQERGNETLEEVGEDILLELIASSMIQVGQRSPNGLIQSCRIHDLLRELAISKAEEDRFLQVCPDSPSGSS